MIAKVQGTAAGIGAHLAFACDLVIVSENAKFIEVFAAPGARRRRPRHLAPPAARRAAARQGTRSCSPRTSARRAPYEIGLATRAWSPPTSSTRPSPTSPAAWPTGPTRAHAVNKWLLNRSLDVDRATMAQEEAWIVDVMAQSLDSDEGVSSFMEKRAPNFRGY